MNSRKKFKFRLPHIFTLLFAIVIFFGILSLILSWAGVTLNDGYEITAKTIEKLQNKTSPKNWIKLTTSKIGENDEILREIDPRTIVGEWIASTPIIGAGITSWFTAVPAGIIKLMWVIVFLFVLGGFINVLLKSQALDAFIGKLSKNFSKNYKIIPKELKAKSKIKYYLAKIKEGICQTWFIIPLMFFFSFCGSVYGMAEESLAFYAIIIPLALAAGFDVWTGFLIIFIGCGVGVMGSTVNPFSVGIAVEIAVDSVKKMKKITSIADGMAWRFAGWILFTIVSIIFVMSYAVCVKRNKNKSEMKDLFVVHSTMFKKISVENAPKLTKRRIATIVVFFMTYFIMIAAMLQYNSLIAGKKSFAGPLATVDKFIGESIFGRIFHNSDVSINMSSDGETDWVFGQWYMGTLAAYFFIVSIILALINKTSESKYIESMVNGVKDMVFVALAIGIAGSIPLILKHTKLENLFANGLSSVLNKIDNEGKGILIPLLSYILFIPLTFVIPSTSSLAESTFGAITKGLVEKKTLLSGTITGYAWGAGLANMIVPTYAVVIGALSITKIPFEKFVRAIWKPILLLFITGIIMIVIGGVITSVMTETKQSIF